MNAELSSVAKASGASIDLFVVRDQHSSIAQRAKIFRGIKAETPGRAEGAKQLPSPSGAVGLARVFDEGQTVSLGKTPDRFHVTCVSVKMNRKNGSRPRPDCRRHGFRVDLKCARIHIDKSGNRTREIDGESRETGGKGRRDHFIPLAWVYRAARFERQDEGIRSGAHAYGKGNVAVLGEFFLERLYLGPENISPAFGYAADRGLNFALVPFRFPAQFQKRNVH